MSTPALKTARPSLPDLFRAEMPVVEKWTYFDHAAVAPLSRPARDAVQNWLAQISENGDVPWLSWSERTEELRKSVAGLVNATTEEIALVPNTTTGIGLIAEGFPWQAGDNVVTCGNEFPSNLFPWMNLEGRGVSLRKLATSDGRIDPEQLERLCDDRTRVVSVSWVGYASGWRLDIAAVAEFCQRRGIFFFLDAIQGLGVFPLDVSVTPVDAFAADGHKWLLGPEGAGVLYVRQQWLEKLRPLLVGWNSVVQRGAFDHTVMELRPTAARYEGGTLNMAGFLGLAASVELLQRLGVTPQASPIAEQILSLTSHAEEELKSLGATILSPRQTGHESGILTFRLPNEPPPETRQRLLANKIVTSCRAGGVRISPHGYNNHAEIDHLISLLRR